MQTIRRVAVSIVLAGVVTGGCSRGPHGGTTPLLPTQPAPATAPGVDAPAALPSAPMAEARQMVVGEIVDEVTIPGDASCPQAGGYPLPCRQLNIVAPTDGILATRITWDTSVDGWKMIVGDVEFADWCCQKQGLAGRVKVLAGQNYRITVSLSPTHLDWMVWGEARNAFQLTAAMEPQASIQ